MDTADSVLGIRAGVNDDTSTTASDIRTRVERSILRIMMLMLGNHRTAQCRRVLSGTPRDMMMRVKKKNSSLYDTKGPFRKD
jgi:hypothetical protein